MSGNNLIIEHSQAVSLLTEPCIYTPLMFNSNLTGTGEGVKICLLDSGVPEHTSISNESVCVNFTDDKVCKDNLGHSTLASGLMAANNQVFGLAPKSKYFYAKMVDDEGRVGIDSIIASVLWGVIKEVDIIVIYMESDINSKALEDAIKKAIDANICVVATKTRGGVYPAGYPGVFTVGEGGVIDLPSGPFYSTYLDNRFAQGSGSSISTSIAAGLMALTIQKIRSENRIIQIHEVYQSLQQSFSAYSEDTLFTSDN